MPIDTEFCSKVWNRYSWARDNGHQEFIDKATMCDRFFRGDQWDPRDLAKLKAARRPALTINKIISVVGNVMGEQIYNRSETAFRPRARATEEVAEALTKVYKQISDNNQLDWQRSDMFADGIITSRGFLDMRIDYGDSLVGEVRVTKLSPKNVIIDPDADDYDPDKWGEVFITKWVTSDDIATLYSPGDAEVLKHREGSAFPYGYDSLASDRDRFGTQLNPAYPADYDHSPVMRNIRLIERQWRTLDKQKHFASAEGDLRAIPADFPRDKIAWFVEKYGFNVVTKLVRRIRWSVIADNVRLHDDWSPYKHFTVIPYFPYFRHGKTIGLVENLIGSQELLNKSSSQELHVVNTTANSGWKVKRGSLTNMTPEELALRGAETGLVLEYNGEPEDLEKITPNSVPAGLDRVSYKAEEHIKSISGVTDYMTGQAREDVSARAVERNKQSGATGLAKPMDSLARSDFILARNALDLIQEFYTEERMMTITKDQVTGETETFAVNQVTPEGTIANDLTLGEYGVIVTSVPHRETMEDSQFDQAVAMREMGVPIPDDVIVDASRLQNKKEIIKKMSGNQDSPEARAAAELQHRAAQAEVAKIEAEAQAKGADAGLRRAKADKTIVETQVLANTPIEDPNAAAGDDPELERARFEYEAGLEERKFEHEKQLAFMEHALKRETENNKLRLQAQDMAARRAEQRAQRDAQMAAAAQRPQPSTPRQGLR
jgi:hypothetical protein